LRSLLGGWGDEDQIGEFLRLGFENEPGDVPEDPAFLAWCAKWERFAATPRAYEAFHRMWYETDVRDVLPAIQVPTLILYKTGSRNWSSQEHGAYLAERIPGAKLVGVSGSSPVVWFEEPTPVVSAIERFLASVGGEEADLNRVLATVLFTDIVGSTERAALLGDRSWRDLVERHHKTVRALLGRYRGQEIDTAGDGFFASFDGPARAVRCAQAIVEAVKPLGLEIRAGVHSGEIETIDGRVGGIAVNIGARVGSIARPSEVLVSQTVKDLVAGSGLVFADAGEYELKGIPDRWRIHRAVR
jgi:class 3 adenylate cyclase